MYQRLVHFPKAGDRNRDFTHARQVLYPGSLPVLRGLLKVIRTALESTKHTGLMEWVLPTPNPLPTSAIVTKYLRKINPTEKRVRG